MTSATASGSTRLATGRKGEERPPRRPLFLGAALRGRVDADGPGLRVRAEGRAETRFPLDRLSRVVAGARLNWSAEALRACFERAIPVVIVREDGSPLGSIQPARVHRARLAEALDELLDRPDWLDVYRCWLRSARMRALTDWRRRQEGGKATTSLRTYQEFVKQQVYCPPAVTGLSTEPAARRTGALWRGVVYSLAAETVLRWGVPPVIWGSGGEPLDLRHDLADLLELRLRLEVREEMEGALKGEKEMLLVFNALSEKLDFEAARAMRSLARRVKEVLSEWR
jgi:hypothetical protein